MLSILYLAVPTGLAAFSIRRLRGVWRIAAIGCLLVMLSAFVRDMIGVANGGNLAGIYTLMLMKSSVLFLVVLHGTCFLTRRAHRMEHVALRRATAFLSSLVLFGVILYAWTQPILFPLGITLGQSAYWTIGGLLALAAGFLSFRMQNPERKTK
ncbi:MAG: hypothetical protein O3C40_13160 [Planctomycetota bacterium]|nr:hypothetical protein [Planctomycetota bacterium]